MGILDSLLGGGGGDSTVETKPWGAQKNYLKDVFSEAQNWYQGGGQSYYPDWSTVSPFNPIQTAAFSGMQNYAGSPQLAGMISGAQGANMNLLNANQNPVYSGVQTSLMPGQQALVGAANRSLNPTSGITGAQGPTDVLNQMMSATPDMSVWGPAMQGVSDVATRDFLNQILPGIRSEALGAGQMGSTRHQLATGQAADYASRNLQNTLAQMGQQAASEALNQRTAGAGLAMNQAQLDLAAQTAREQALQNLYGQGIQAAGTGLGGIGSVYSPTLGAQTNAVANAPGMAEFGMYPSNILSSVGGQYQGQSQSQLTDELNRYMAQQGAPLQNLTSYLGLVNGNYGSTTTQNMSSNPLMNLMNLGLMGASIYSGFGGMGGMGSAAPAATSTAMAAPGAWNSQFALPVR